MIDTIGASAASMDAVNRQFDTIAHNLANSSTTGFKRSICVQTSGLDGATGAPSAGAGIAASSSIDFSQGNFIQTGRKLDLALSGPGFFTLETKHGPLYTRNGTFMTNAEGQLVDGNGRTVAGDSGPIMIPKNAPESSISIGKDGRVTVRNTPIGKLKLAEFKDLATLTPVGDSAFRADGHPEDATKTTVQQGFQESSNVSVVEEMVGLITASRTYEANVKAISSNTERAKSLLQVALG